MSTIIPLRLAVFISGRGTNLEAILNAINTGSLDAEVVLIASNNADAGGLRIAEDNDIPVIITDRNTFSDGTEFAEYILNALNNHQVELIVLAGYLRKMPPAVVRVFHNRIVNIHPALLPKFGGKGMFGLNVHSAVIDAGEIETGVTIHYVNEIYDGGDIIAQRKISVMHNDTPETLAARVLQVEHKFYPEVLQQLVEKIRSKTE